ncbi:hypothetical protein SAVCW2_67740 [Streptomyces avermitilis]|uniref:Uncharacterized protein n=1 Tax=Streptomyces avermitilis TaxID=33903 RepID=A0A4D4N2L9_STRAX|nr:hypothetical protein SAV31267_082360 [Streptomyces avermitilis]GDY87575.1 hypothetical protein SAVCW2_67740 [Streptomyces avermitilis]
MPRNCPSVADSANDGAARQITLVCRNGWRPTSGEAESITEVPFRSAAWPLRLCRLGLSSMRRIAARNKGGPRRNSAPARA